MRRRSRRPADRGARKRRRAGLWRWLGAGALGLAAAALLRGERREARAGAQRRDPPEETPAPRPPLFEPPDDAESSWIPGAAGTLHIVERHPGGSLPIVFIHGLGGRAEQWSAQLADAGPALRAVALDLPGHGRSDLAADGDYSVAALASAVGATADALGLRRAVLVAHSLGAAAAIEYARSHPQRVAGLLLVDPGGDQTRLPESQRQRFLAQLRSDPGEELSWHFRQLLIGASPEVADRVLADLASLPDDVALAALEGAAAYGLAAALEGYGGPVKSVISDLNSLPYSLHRLLPELPVKRISSASHWLMMDRPDELWEILVDFLDGVAAGGLATQANGRDTPA